MMCMKKFQLYSLVLLGFLCSHCSEAEDPDMACPIVAVIGADDDIVGKWKLVKGQTVFYEPRTEDYSCSDIVYHFQQDGILTISSVKEDYSPDPSAYEFDQISLYAHEFTLKIGNRKYGCSISEGRMILDGSPLDGPIRYFVRIQ